jgi:hypothetical protein
MSFIFLQMRKNGLLKLQWKLTDCLGAIDGNIEEWSQRMGLNTSSIRVYFLHSKKNIVKFTKKNLKLEPHQLLSIYFTKLVVK